MATATHTDISTPAVGAIDWSLDPSLVKVKIGYPAKYEGVKHFQDGSTQWVSRASADQFIDAGIATEASRTMDEKADIDATTSTESAATSNDAKLDAKKVTGTNAVHSDEASAKAAGAEALEAGKTKKA